MVTAMHTTEPVTAGSSAPTNLAVINSGMTKAMPEPSAICHTPLRALGPLPSIMTMISGVATTISASWSTTTTAVWEASNPVTEAAVMVGMPMEPKAVGVALATRHTRAAWMGLKPRPHRMPAGIATAVPKPAIPSMNPPKPQAMMSTSTRLSQVTAVSIRLMVSIAPVRTVRL